MPLFCLEPGDVISLIGGGGKTTLMYLFLKRTNCVATTTTKIKVPERYPLVLVKDPNELSLVKGGCVVGREVKEGKVIGIEPEWVDDISRNFPVVVEADGSKRKPLKLYAPWEPVIPKCSKLVVVVAGLDALWNNFEDVVFRWEMRKDMAGKKVDYEVFSELVLETLSKAPERSKALVFLNKLDVASEEDVFEVGKRLRSKGVSRILYGSLKKEVIKEL